MARPCSVCQHKARNDIDRALLNGEMFRALERQYSLSRDALRRHKAEHIPAVMVKAQEAEVVTRADNLLDYLHSLQGDAHRLKDLAEKGGDIKTALASIRELVRIVELLAKLQGTLQEGVSINIAVAPEWVSLRTEVLIALEPFPEARRAVALRLGHAG